MRMFRALAVVCAGVALTTLALFWSRRYSHPLADLARLLGERRFIEPRLTGDFAHTPCAPMEEGGRTILRVRCTEAPEQGSPKWKELVAGIQAFAAGGDRHGIEPLHRKGAAALVWPQSEESVARAVTALQGAAEKAAEAPDIWSDLAAALFVLAQWRDEPELLVQGLAAANEAVRLEPELPEAWFNRALILERLFLIDGARKAWDEFLRLDGVSGWADEARERQAALERHSGRELWQQRLPDLRAAALQKDHAEVREIVALSPQAAREHALENFLGEWGDLAARGRAADAEAPLQMARAVGEALLAETGEPSVADAVAAINRAASLGTLLTLAKGHRDYRAGQLAYRRQLLGEALPLLEAARAALGREESPALAWTLISLAGIDLSVSRYDQAVDKYTAALVASGQAEPHSLAGCVAWGIGLVRLRQGQFSESLSQLREAESVFAGGREWENLGAILQMLAANLRFIGQRSMGWRYRYRSMEALSASRDSLRLHNVLWEGGWAGVEDGMPRAGLDFLDECAGLAAHSRLPQRQAEALLWRSKIHLALDEVTAALDDLLEAQRQNRQTHDALIRERIAADLAYVEGEVRYRTDPEAALQPLSRAVDFYGARQLYLDLAGAYLTRFRSALRAGQEERAERDLEAALHLFERRRDSLIDSSLRLSAAEMAQSLYDEVLLLRARRQGNLAALLVAERARGNLIRTLAELSAATPSGLAVLEYARVGDHLFVWLLHEGRIESFSRSVAPGSLEERVREFVSAIKGREPVARLDPKAKELYRLLIPEAVASLPANTELVIVPDKVLNALPFAVLKDPVTGAYLVEQRTLRTALSTAVGPKRSPSPAAVGSALLVAATEFDRALFPNLELLPKAQTEVRAVERLYRQAGRVLLGSAATKTRILAELEDKEIFHFAGHAVFNPQHPDYSYFLLAPAREPVDAGMLFLHELEGRRFDTLRLVVLSACNTLGPLETRTGGISGLARPFLKAGADAVAGSLWAVPDAAAAQLLPDFHRRYLESGDAAAALRGAQREMLASPDPFLAHPSSWGFLQIVSNSTKGGTNG